MIKIILTLILFISSSVLAENISDFELKGISIGDSVLNFYSQEEINNGLITEYPNSKKIIELSIIEEEHDDFEQMNFSVYSNDDQYIILSLSGYMNFENNVEECLIKKDNIENDILDILDIQNIEIDEYTYQYEKIGDGKNYAYITDYDLSDGSIRIYCNEWSDASKSLEQYNLNDSLTVAVSSNKYLYFIDNEAY